MSARRVPGRSSETSCSEDETITREPNLSIAGFDAKEASDETCDRVAKKLRSERAIVGGGSAR